jgi:hypothetical protein
MRITSSVTSVSWIPSEGVPGPMKLGFESGTLHYDQPPEPVLGSLEDWRVNDRFRFANELRAWIDVDDDGRITGYGHEGQGWMGSTTLRLGKNEATVPAVPFPDLQPEPDVGADFVRFTQTTGGRAGLKGPRRLHIPPYFAVQAPVVWTTLELTIRTDGSAEGRLVGASAFPRHWVYDDEGQLAAKSGRLQFSEWYHNAVEERSPWSAWDAPIEVAPAETATERQLSHHVMHGGHKSKVRRLKPGVALTEQGDRDDDIYLVLDGVLEVDVDGAPVGELGPGAVIGERAALETGRRTATVRARTRSVVAVVRPDRLDASLLEDLVEGHRREEA